MTTSAYTAAATRAQPTCSTYGPKAAALTLVGDMLKAALAVILGYLLVNNRAVAYNEAGRFIGVFGDKPGAAVA